MSLSLVSPVDLRTFGGMLWIINYLKSIFYETKNIKIIL